MSVFNNVSLFLSVVLELRLVLLGSAGAGKSSAVSAILGGPTSESDSAGPETPATDCQKRRMSLAGRQ
ncbi:hypothetical protein M9458_006935, partial [Cirrhinus mrigala]